MALASDGHRMAGWRSPEAPSKAWTQGLLAGAGFGLSSFVAVLVTDALLALVVIAALALVFLGLPWAFADLARRRRSADWRVTAALAALAATFVALALVSWVSYREVLDNDSYFLLFPPLTLLMLADRFAARGNALWRDRALAAACGFLAVWPFIVDVFLPARIVVPVSAGALLALLPARLPGPARAVAALLAGFPALTLGGFVHSTLVGRALEWTAFLAYAALSLLAWRRDHGAPPAPGPSVVHG